MSKQFKGVLSGLVVLAVIGSFSLFAQSPQKSKLSEIWVVDVPFQQASEFEKLLNGYINDRKIAGDNNPWEIYKAQASSHLDSYLIRHCCFQKANRSDYESWLNKNDLQINWSTSDSIDVADFEYFFSPSKFSALEDETLPNKVAVSQFTLMQGIGVKGSSNRIKQNAKDIEWGESWAWTFEGYSKGLLNFNFDKAQDESEDIASQFDLEQMVNDLQFDPTLNVSNSRYTIYSLVSEK